MSKEDVETPPRPPHKQKQLKQALDVWLAVWANDESLSPSERRRAQEERARRKAASPDFHIGLIYGYEGVTPEQREAIFEAVPQHSTHLEWPSFHVRLKIPKLGMKVTAHDEMRDIVLASDAVIVAPNKPGPDHSLMEWVRYAKHRKVALTVILPDGERANEEVR